MFLRQYVNDLLDIVYPNLCSGCNKSLIGNEVALCTHCRVSLPHTNSHLLPVAELANKFAGKLPIENVFAFLRFERGGRVQRLLHQLKYRNKQEVGTELGRMYGQVLKQGSHVAIQNFDLIVPVPLHARKKLQRGYNQSELFAQGLSEIVEIDWNGDILKRSKFTETQTHKSRIQRFENVAQIFEVTDIEKIRHKHIILVDDVLTTGSTLESAASTLLEQGAKKITIMTIAAAY